MPVGFEVYNSDGSIQFDTSYITLVYAGKGTHNTATNTSPSPIGSRSRLDVPVGTAKIVAFRPKDENVFVFIYRTVVSGGTKQFHLMCNDDNADIDWWAFDVPASPPSNYGLQLFNASGNLTYHSFAYPMKVVGVINDPVSAELAADATLLTPPSGRTWALVQGSPAGVVGDVRAGPTSFRWEARWAAVYRSGNSIGVQQRLLDRESSTHTEIETELTAYGPRNFLAIDVTDI